MATDTTTPAPSDLVALVLKGEVAPPPDFSDHLAIGCGGYARPLAHCPCLRHARWRKELGLPTVTGWQTPAEECRPPGAALKRKLAIE